MVSSPARASQKVGVTPSRLKVLVAGVGKEERGAVQAAVGRAFAGRDPAEEWSVSLVRLGRKWSVVLNGPTETLSNLSFTAEGPRLAETIRDAIREKGNDGNPLPSPAAQPVGQPARLPVRDQHVCARCRKTMLVSYESGLEEPKKLAPVACPHCWEVSQVPIGAWAIEGGDYRAEKA